MSKHFPWFLLCHAVKKPGPSYISFKDRKGGELLFQQAPMGLHGHGEYGIISIDGLLWPLGAGEVYNLYGRKSLSMVTSRTGCEKPIPTCGSPKDRRILASL